MAVRRVQLPLRRWALSIGIAVFICASVIAFGSKPDWRAAGRQWWTHISYLANDNLQGRAVGSSGYDRAADYVAMQFQKAGLRPGGIDNFFQPVAFVELTIDEEQSSIALERRGQSARVALGNDALLGVGPDASRDVLARLVFVGYGLRIPEANWDDLAGQDLSGAVCVYLTGGPASISGNLRSHYSSTGQRWAMMRAAGAVGMIAIPNPKEMEMSWKRIAQNRTTPRMVLADENLRDTKGEQFSATWNPDKAPLLFGGEKFSFEDVVKAATEHKSLPHFRFERTVKAATAFKQQRISSKNVIGIRWGTDTKLAHEFVVFSAHLDHLGEGPIGAPDRIYNGAMDDASGIASLIEIAQAMQHRKLQTKRSILFLAVTAEEKGELGSRYYAEHPSVEGKYAADLNMDMFLPLFPLRYLEVQGLDESTLGDDIRAVCQRFGIEVQADKEPNRNRFIRSDQYSFIKKGVPALAFKFGYIPGTPEEKTFRDWYSQRYHAVTDDLNQPVDLAAAAEFDDVLLTLGLRVADAHELPAWKEGSFFERFAH
jgi:hypothetical protein